MPVQSTKEEKEGIMRKNGTKKAIKKVTKAAVKNQTATVAIAATTASFAIFGAVEATIKVAGVIKNHFKKEDTNDNSNSSNNDNNNNKDEKKEDNKNNNNDNTTPEQPQQKPAEEKDNKDNNEEAAE